MTRLNVHSLKNIDPTDVYAAGQAYHRADMLFRNDPMIAMLSQDARESLTNAIFSFDGLGNETLSPTGGTEIQHIVARIISEGPLCFVGDAFKVRVAALTILAITPENIGESAKARLGYPAPVNA